VHELGIAGALIAAVEAEASRRRPARVVRAGVRIGQLAGVDAEALRFCVEALVEATPLETMALDIELAAGDELDLTYLEVDSP
jgi:hydrogenase nickel incorporation protein HypA/HybF